MTAKRSRDSLTASGSVPRDSITEKKARKHETVPEENGDNPRVLADSSNAAPTSDQPDIAAQEAGGTSSDDEPLLPAHISRGGGIKQGAECPYLDTVNRQNLDFDFEKCCSVSLSPVNVYACLVCGKYFQGRGPRTQAYTHALECTHHMFMKLDNGKVFCLPDGYEVVERSLDDIRHVLDPAFTPSDVAALDSSVSWARTLEGAEYMPGLLGLNDMRANDYANVIIQVLVRVVPLRNFFLRPSNYAGVRSQLVDRFGELVRKIWNPRNFKGQVSPHEFMQAVMTGSAKRFTIEKQSDPVDFLTWLLNSLHAALTKGKRSKPSIITKCFQGELQVTTEAGTGTAADSTEDVVEKVPFLVLAMDLPPAPLYKDALEKNIIPQVAIFELLHKYDGNRVHHDIKAGRRRYQFLRLPTFLAVHMKRFMKNNFYVEKNPTIVNFPVKNFRLDGAVALPPDLKKDAVKSTYDLLANICHDGKAGEGSYLVHVHRQVEDLWYEVQDLRVNDILPQMVALSESYCQLWQLRQ